MKVVEQGLVSLKMLHQNYFHAALKILKLTFSVFVFYGALDFLIFHFFWSFYPNEPWQYFMSPTWSMGNIIILSFQLPYKAKWLLLFEDELSCYNFRYTKFSCFGKYKSIQSPSCSTGKLSTHYNHITENNNHSTLFFHFCLLDLNQIFWLFF